MKLFKLSIILITAYLLNSCIFNDGHPGRTEGNQKDELTFIGSYFSDSSTPDYLAKYVVDLKSGETTITNISEKIPDRYLSYSTFEHGTVRNGRFAYLADYSNFEDESRYVLYFNLDEAYIYQCPIPKLYPEDNLIPWLRNVRVHIDNKGRIFYCIWYSVEYGDLHCPTIIRYDPETDSYDYTRGANDFVASQPEIGSDTERGAFQEAFAISNDGTYAYAVIYGYGTSGGAYHQDYRFIVSYNFDTGEITRIDGGSTGGAQIYGINSDYSSLLYSLGGQVKFRNLNSQSSNEVTVYVPGTPHESYTTNGCLDAKTTGIYFVDLAKDTETKIVQSYGTSSPQFDDEGNVIFILEGQENNYICKKIGLDELSSNQWDTIASIPPNVNYLVLVK